MPSSADFFKNLGAGCPIFLRKINFSFVAFLAVLEFTFLKNSVFRINSLILTM
jgi:hypothetical protein